MKENFEQKKRRVLTGMAVEETIKAVENAKEFLKNPERVGTVDLDKVRRLNAKIKNINPVPGLETERFLFSYKNKFHLVEAGKYRKVDDPEVRKKVDEHSDMKLYYLCTDSGMCPLPPAFVGKEAKGVQVKDDAAVIDYIKKITGAELKPSDL